MSRIKIMLLAIVLLSPLYSFAQDIITTAGGTDIKAKVTNITDKTVRYRVWKSEDTTAKEIDKKDIFRIVYENGSKDVFSDNIKTTDTVSMSVRGKQDAQKYYKKYNSAATGTLVTSALTGLLGGLIPALATSTTPPKSKHLGYPHPELMNNPEYKSAYEKTAYRIKKRKVWGGYVTGFFIDAAIVIFLAVAK